MSILVVARVCMLIKAFILDLFAAGLYWSMLLFQALLLAKSSKYTWMINRMASVVDLPVVVDSLCVDVV